MKFRGEYIPTRGSNKKHRVLDDLDALFERLKVKCPAHVAKDLKVPPTSVLYLIDSYFNEAEKAQVAWARKRVSKPRNKAAE